MYIECPKCKAKTFIGLISQVYKSRIDKNYRLMQKWKKAKTPEERGRIMREVRRLETEEELWEKSV